jgi:hypothetical protein
MAYSVQNARCVIILVVFLPLLILSRIGLVLPCPAYQQWHTTLAVVLHKPVPVVFPLEEDPAL